MRPLDLTGWTIGELKVVGLAGRDERGRLWQCECKPCGRLLVRPSCQLLRAVRDGVMSACSDCRAEYRGGQLAMLMEKRHEYFKAMWNEYGTLYAWDNQPIDALELEPVTENNCTAIPADELFESTEQYKYAATLEEIGAALQISRERVRQIEIHALSKLRAWFHKHDKREQRQLVSVEERKRAHADFMARKRPWPSVY